jgi:hypothetical protein
MSQFYGYIYLTLDHYANKVYVGRHKGLAENSEDYFGSGTIISRIIKKRKHHLEKIILGYCNSLEELIEAETECIYFFRAYGADGINHDEIYGYNLESDGKFGGGRKGIRFSKSHIHNISKSLIGNKRQLGHKHSEEHKQNISKALKGRKSPNGFAGHKHSEETKLKLSEIKKGKKRRKKI